MSTQSTVPSTAAETVSVPPRARWSLSTQAPPRIALFPLALATCTSVAALLALVAIGSGLNEVVLIPPLAASMALVAGAPALPLAQPRAVIGGQLLSALVGLAVGALAGHSMWSAAVAGGLALGAMLLLRVSHSPAAATAIIAAHEAPSPALFLSLLALATVVLICVGIAGARAAGNRNYPLYWW